MRNPEETVGKMIDNAGVSFLGSIDEDGFPNIKAMLRPRKREGIQTIWFSTNTSSLRVAQFRKNPKASVYICDRRFFRGVMLRGTVEVIETTACKEMLWQEGDTHFYPLGVTDPDYCTLCFTVQSGRYYSGRKSENFLV